MCLPVTLILFSLLSILLFPFFFCFFAISICRNLRGTKNGFLTAFLTAFLTVRKNPASFLPLAALLLRLRCPDALRRLTASPGYVIPTVHLQLLLSSPYSHFFLFYFISPFSIPFLFLYIFICTSFFSFSFYAYLYVYISPCFRNATASTAANFISVHMLACAFFFFLLCCICLAAYFFIPGYTCMHIIFLCIPLRIYLISQSAYACRTLYIFFCVYLYVCILLLEVYIQGCVFIYKNAYLKRMYKKEKCIHYVAHFFLPAAAGRILKMYTHACTHKKPSQRAGYI